MLVAYSSMNYLTLFELLCVRFDMANVANSRKRGLSFCIICTMVRMPSKVTLVNETEWKASDTNRGFGWFLD